MRLRAKLTLTIAVASVVPVVGATLVGRELIERKSRAEFERLLDDGVKQVGALYHSLQEDVRRAVERLADPEDQFIGPILIALSGGGLDDDTFRQLALSTPRVMRERGLEVLAVVGPRGEILASGHFPGRMGDVDPRFTRAPAPARFRRAMLLPERVLEERKPTTHLSVQVWRAARSPLGSRLVVVGGSLLGREFVRRLRLRGGTEVVIEDARGAVVAGPLDPARVTATPHRRVVELPDPSGSVAARIVLAVPDAGLRATLRALNLSALGVSLSGLGLSLLLGFLAARPIGRRLQELVRGAEAVAAGDLEKQLPPGSRDEVGELVLAFNRMTVELKESKERLVAAERLAAWQEIARRIAHEIKNPLFPIQTSIETMRKVYDKGHPDFDEIFHESTTMILEEVTRLKNIVSEFSAFARLPKPRLARLQLGELIPQVVGLYGSGELVVACALPDDLPEVLGDRDQLTQVLVNLIGNARDALAGRPDARLTVGGATREGWVEIAVEDNGPGFDEAVGASLFVPYFTTKGRSGGTGLGLAIAHRIVTDHGGRIEARSQEGRGATFLIHLPVAGPDAPRGTGEG